MSIIVDASMAVAWLFPDQQTATTRTVLEEVGSEGGFAPSLWKLEVANVLWSAVRRKRIDEGFVTASLNLLTRLQIAIDSETDDHAWTTTRGLAFKYDLTSYDAAYLELAIRRRGVLATLDERLAAAGRKAGIDVVGSDAQ